MRLDDCFLLGHITKPHGLKGEVSVFLDTDAPEDYSEMESVFVLVANKLVPFFIDTLDIRKDRAIIKFESVDSFEQAEELRGAELYLPLSILPELDNKSFYFHEITDFVVNDIRHGKIGTVKAVYASGPQDLLAVDAAGKEILIPVHDDIIIEVKREEKELLVEIPDGLLEIYLNE